MNDEVVIVHLSDLHIAEEIKDPINGRTDLKLPHRYGHNVNVLGALDDFLNNRLEWDVLVITGDLTRIGNERSFEWVRNWILHRHDFGHGFSIGLDLATKRKKWVVIPGNHDRFNGELTQQDELVNYHAFFDAIRYDHRESVICKGLQIVFHLYDTSMANGSFGYGKLGPLAPKHIAQNTFNIALLHHHIMMPPKQKREPRTEMVNTSEAIAYLLNCEFNAIFFGHTHKTCFDRVHNKIILQQLPNRRSIGSVFRKLLPKFLLLQLTEDTVHYPRVRAKNGQYPRFSAYFKYRYIKEVLRLPVMGPAQFHNVKQFYDHLDQFSEDYKPRLKAVLDKQTIISMAPSACQTEAITNGFHVIRVLHSSGHVSKTLCQCYEYSGNTFNLSKEKVYI